MVKFVAITVPCAAIYSRRHGSTVLVIKTLVYMTISVGSMETIL